MQLRAYLAAGIQGRARSGGTDLSLRPHFDCVRNRPALAAHSRNRCPCAARLFLALAAGVKSADPLHLLHREHLVG